MVSNSLPLFFESLIESDNDLQAPVRGRVTVAHPGRRGRASSAPGPARVGPLFVRRGDLRLLASGSRRASLGSSGVGMSARAAGTRADGRFVANTVMMI